jgi:septum formation protein
MLLLASASPRRRDLLTQAGYSFRVDPIPIVEQRHPGEEPIAMAQRLAREKAEAVYHACALTCGQPDDPLLVLGADTIVVCGDEVLGKPVDEADAMRMLRLLSGRVHQVVTGVCLVSSAGVDVAAESTQVTMSPISEEEIRAYAASGEPMGKAGAYAIQGRAARWIPRIEGCYFNVVGLPISLISTLLEFRATAGG